MSDATEQDLSFIVTDGILTIDDVITTESLRPIISYITQANFPPPDTEQLKSITLMISSPGGDLEATFSLISIMRASVIPINTVATGICASGGLMIALAGKTRLVDKYTNIMSHVLSTAYPEFAKPAELKNWLNSVHMHKQKMIDLYIEYTNIKTEKEIIKKLLPENLDMYLTAEKAIRYGLFDGYFESFAQLEDI